MTERPGDVLPPPSEPFDDHTDAPDVGRLATEAGVSTLVLYHLIPGSPAVTDDDRVDLVRPHFAGEVIVARDLLVL